MDVTLREKIAYLGRQDVRLNVEMMSFEDLVPPNSSAYFDELWKRRGSASKLNPMSAIYADGTCPIPNQCHFNVDRWVFENPTYGAVRGWLIEVEYTDSAHFVAHSVVRDKSGILLDLTLPQAHRFLAHDGDEDSYGSLKVWNAQRWWPPSRR